MRLLLITVLVIISRTVSQVCRYEDSVELTNRIFNGIQYELGEVFVDNETGVERGCICLKQKCIRKCCPFGKFFNYSLGECDDSVKEFHPSVWDGSEEKQGFNFTKNFHVIISQPRIECTENEDRLFLGKIAEYLRLNSDGNIYVREGGAVKDSVYTPDKYCLDNFLDLDKPPALKLSAIGCQVKEYNEKHLVVKATCMVISCFFIILTVAVYGFLPEFRTTIHGKVMLAYLSSFFFGFLLLASMTYITIYGYIDRSTCTIIAFILYYFLLAAFFWLNVMSYDIYRKISKVDMVKDTRSRFYWYCAYAFGMPTALTVILAGLEFSGLPKNNILLPNIRKGHCFLSGTTRWVYLFIPISVICAINLVFFSLIAKRLSQISKDTRRLHKKHTQQFGLYVKLFIVAGISWIFDVISDFYPDLDNFWLITDAYNVLVGLMVFIIFVCKKKVLLSLHALLSLHSFRGEYNKYNQFRGIKPQIYKPTSDSSLSQTTVTQSVEEVQMASVAESENFEPGATKL